MSRYIAESLRGLVMARADHKCEYCLLDAEDAFFPFEIDHIISLKHGGATHADNLAFRGCLEFGVCSPKAGFWGSDKEFLREIAGYFEEK